jgi:hypothetical protein
MEFWAALIGGLGIGGVVSQVVGHVLGQRRAWRERLLSERQRCFAGYLEAVNDYHEAATDGQRPGMGIAYWESRSQLVATEECMTAVSHFSETFLKSAWSAESESAYRSMITWMRGDVGLKPTGKS